MSWGFPLIHIVVPFSSILQVLFIILGSKTLYHHREVSRNHYIKSGEQTPLEPNNNGNFLHPNYQTEVGGHIAYVKGIPMTSLSGRPLGSGNYNFYICQYWPCDIDFPVILTQNHCGKRMVIPGHKCITVTASWWVSASWYHCWSQMKPANS